MNWKKLLGALAGIGATVGLAVAHNIDTVIAHPGTILTIIGGTIAGLLFGHDAGTTSGADKQAEATGTANVVTPAK